MSETLEPFVPSLVIALSTCAVFAAGRLAGWAASRSARATTLVRAAAIALAVAAAAFLVLTRSSRWALLLPLALVAGTVTARRTRPPGLFEPPA